MKKTVIGMVSFVNVLLFYAKLHKACKDGIGKQKYFNCGINIASYRSSVVG